MVKYGFSIRTKGGHKVDNIVIMARDMDEAERRLRQMYTQCQIVHQQEAPPVTDARRYAVNLKFLTEVCKVSLQHHRLVCF